MAASRPPCRSAWPDLPADLLGVVLGRLPSLGDRVRLRAVCPPWRSSAATMSMLHLSSPQLPWLVFRDGTLLDVSNNTTHRVRLPGDAAICYGAGENMLFLLHDDGRCSLLNTFSSDVTPLPEIAALLKVHDAAKSSEIIIKVVTSSSPRLVAVLFSSRYGSGILASTCRPAGESNSCQVLLAQKQSWYTDTIFDIVLFQGKIHAISSDHELLAVHLNDDEQTPCFVKQIDGTFDDEIQPYLVESNGKLLMVRRWESGNWFNKGRTRKLDVVEADLSRGQWNEVDGLEGQALFVSRLCSKSVPAAAVGDQQECVYFTHEYDFSTHKGDRRDSAAYRYNMGDRRITPLMPEQFAPVLPWDSRQPRPAWFFPVEA